MSILTNLAFADFDQEVAATRRVLARLPDEHFDWKPHEKSTALGALGAHLLNTLRNQVLVLTTTELDFATLPPRPRPETAAALLEAWDAALAELQTALDAVDPETLADDWTARFGDRVVFTRPRAVVFRSFGLSHMAHHRGQLTVYLRLLGIPVPSVYGPTADES